MVENSPKFSSFCTMFTLLIFGVLARFLFGPSMVRNEDAFTQRFQTTKGVRARFLWPQNQTKLSPDTFHENMVRKVYTKVSGSYQLF